MFNYIIVGGIHKVGVFLSPPMCACVFLFLLFTNAILVALSSMCFWYDEAGSLLLKAAACCGAAVAAAEEVRAA